MRCSQPVLWRYAWRPTVEMGIAGRVDSPEKPRINYAFFFVLLSLLQTISYRYLRVYFTYEPKKKMFGAIVAGRLVYVTTHS